MRLITTEDVEFLAKSNQPHIEFVDDPSCIVESYKLSPYRSRKKRHIKKWRSKTCNTIRTPVLLACKAGYYGQITEVHGTYAMFCELRRIIDKLSDAHLDAEFDAEANGTSNTPWPLWREGRGW